MDSTVVKTVVAEKRYWPGFPDDAYTKAEWREFVQAQHSGAAEQFIDTETNRLWIMAKSRLCDHPRPPRRSRSPCWDMRQL